MFKKNSVKDDDDISELGFYDLNSELTPVNFGLLTGSSRMEEEILDAESKEIQNNDSFMTSNSIEEVVLPVVKAGESRASRKRSIPSTLTVAEERAHKSTFKRRTRNKVNVKQYEFSGGKPQHWPRWNEVEDIFLQGIVVDTYSRRHSLKPLKEELKIGARVIWEQIHQRYKTACRRHSELTGEVMGDRSLRAIQKRWKRGQHSDENDITTDESGNFVNPMPTYKRYQREWDDRYNINGILTCTENLFREASDIYLHSLPECN